MLVICVRQWWYIDMGDVTSPMCLNAHIYETFIHDTHVRHSYMTHMCDIHTWRMCTKYTCECVSVSRVWNESFVSLQHTATHSNTLQHTWTHCNTLQHTVTHCNTHLNVSVSHVYEMSHLYHCNTLQHTPTHSNTHVNVSVSHVYEMSHLYHCNTLQYTATHSNTLQHTPTHSNTLKHTCECISVSRVWNKSFVSLQHTATHMWMYQCLSCMKW